MILESVISCPLCGSAKSESMATNACRIFYKCTGCGAMLHPKHGDCCVFCSYGSVPCPPDSVWEFRQERRSVMLCTVTGLAARVVQNSRDWLSTGYHLITAKALGLDIPPTLLALADEVIE